MNASKPFSKSRFKDFVSSLAFSISISVIATPIILNIADKVLVRSFENVLNIKIFHMVIIRTFAWVLSINFSTLFFAIILSAIELKKYNNRLNLFEIANL